MFKNNSNSKQNQNTDINSNPKPPQKKQKELVSQTSLALDNKTSQTEKKIRQLKEQILPQDQKEKAEHRQLSRLRNQPRKDYKTFIPQSKILKKVEFQEPF